MGNHYKQSNNEEEKPKKEGKKRFSRALTSAFSGNFLKQDNVINALPFIFFLVLLGLVYIGNGFVFENQIRKITKTKDEVKDMRARYITIQSKLNFNSKQSQVAKSVAPLGLVIPQQPPYRIMIDKYIYNSIHKND